MRYGSRVASSTERMGAADLGQPHMGGAQWLQSAASCLAQKCSPHLQGSRGQDKGCAPQEASVSSSTPRLELDVDSTEPHCRHLLQPAASLPPDVGISSDGSEAAAFGGARWTSGQGACMSWQRTP